MSSAPTEFDVIIVGAGLSGIGAGRYLTTELPATSFAVLEARGASGGTWDLFRYPGIRSDSDMHTLGYNFRPWRDGLAIAEGGKIRSYIEDTAREARLRALERARRGLPGTIATSARGVLDPAPAFAARKTLLGE